MLRFAAFGSLVVLAICVTLVPGLSDRLRGAPALRPPSVSSLDEDVVVDEHGAAEFFDERDRLEVVVDGEMTVRDFLQLHRLYGRQHIRDQLAKQLGVDPLSDATLIRAGTTFHLRLTPPEERLP